MTDNEIIKALECCIDTDMRADCEEDCPYEFTLGCYIDLRRKSLELIKKQQAEIERLKVESKILLTNIYKKTLESGLAEEARAEAIKEFADKLKAKAHTAPVSWYEMYMTVEKIVTVKDIDNLVKEMGCGE